MHSVYSSVCLLPSLVYRSRCGVDLQLAHIAILDQNIPVEQFLPQVLAGRHFVA